MSYQTPANSDSIPVSQEPVAVPLSHLEHDLRLIQRYTIIHSNAPFTSSVPIVGPLIVVSKRAARYILRGLLRASIGGQDDFNAAVAEILFEFTRRASSPEPLALNDGPLDHALRALEDKDGACAGAVTLLAREIRLLQEQVRAAQLAAAENERALAELRRQIDALRRITEK